MWQLVLEDGTVINPGDKLYSFRGEPYIFVKILKVPEGNSSGKITMRHVEEGGYAQDFYPSVFNCHIEKV